MVLQFEMFTVEVGGGGQDSSKGDGKRESFRGHAGNNGKGGISNIAPNYGVKNGLDFASNATTDGISSLTDGTGGGTGAGTGDGRAGIAAGGGGYGGGGSGASAAGGGNYATGANIIVPGNEDMTGATINYPPFSKDPDYDGSAGVGSNDVSVPNMTAGNGLAVIFGSNNLC